MRKWRFILLLAILLIALALRMKSLDWGFPDFLEDKLSISFLQNFWGVYSGKLSLRPHRYDWSPFYYYLVFFVQYVYYLFGRLTGHFADLIII